LVKSRSGCTYPITKKVPNIGLLSLHYFSVSDQCLLVLQYVSELETQEEKLGNDKEQ